MLVAKFNALAGTVLLASGGGGGGTPDPLEFNVDLALWTLIIFLGLLAVLTKFAWKPIMEGLNAREKGIADDIENARLASEQADKNLEQYEAKLAGVNDEASAILAEAKKDATSAKDKILADANEEAKRTRDRALADIEAAKNAAVQELAEKSVDSAVSLAGNIVGRSLDKKDHSKLIEKSINSFKGGA